MSNELVFAIIGTLAGVLGLAVAAYYGAMTLRLKSGTHVRGTYHTVRGTACEDIYVSSITLENLKDRAVVIFGISLQIGHSNYIVLDDFEKEPLILRPFEAITRPYGPIVNYTVNGRRIDFNKIIWDPKVQKRIVLETSDRKYRVKETLRPWQLVHEAFRNDYTVIALPHRSSYKGTIYGGNVKYIVDIDAGLPSAEIVPLQKHVNDYHKFAEFVLTKEALETCDLLESFLKQQRDTGKLDCQKFFVVDLDAARARQQWHMHPGAPISAPNLTWSEYHIEGRRYTKRLTRELREKNEQASIAKEATTMPVPPVSPPSSPDGVVI